jgi:hypothetical protein
MTVARIRELTVRILYGAGFGEANVGWPKVAGSYAVFVQNQPDGGFRMAVTDFDALGDEFELSVEGGISLAIAEAVEPGFFDVIVAVRWNGRIVSATYTIPESQVKGLWLRLREDSTALEASRN